MSVSSTRMLVCIETARKLDIESFSSVIPGCVEVDAAQAKIAAMKCGSIVDGRLGKPPVEKKADYSKAVRKTWDQKKDKEYFAEESEGD